MAKTQKIPRKRRKDERPGEIIEAGLAEFAQKGFAATRLEDVAKRAGISKGTIYRYFDDKEALFLASMQSMATPAFEDLEAAIASSDLPTRELLRVMVLRAHTLLTAGELPTLMHIIISEGRHFPQLTQMYHDQGVSRGRQLLSSIINRGIERGDIRENAATALPIVLLAPAIMAAIWNMTFSAQSPIDPKEFLDAHLDLVFEGIWAEQTTGSRP